MSQLKGAIAGFGNIAVNGHLPGYRETDAVSITAVTDVMPEAQESCRKHLPNARFYSSLEELLNKEDVDFVDIATPPGMHAENILVSLKHGRHVLCEKPLVLDSADYIKIKKLSKEKGRIVFTVHNWRYAPIFQETSRLITEGAIGKVHEIEYRVIRVRPSITSGESGVKDNWRIDPAVAGGGILVDHGWHAFYMTNQWMDQNPLWVKCKLSNLKYKDIPLEDTAEVEVGYKDAIAKLFFTWAGESRKNTVLINGEQGSLLIDDDVIRLETKEDTLEIPFDQALSQGSHHPEWYAAVFREFVNEITGKDQAGKNFIEAGWCQSMMEKCTESSAKGEKVALSGPEN